jgi:hypothetical protein
MHVEPQVAVGALDGGHGAGLARGQATLEVTLAVPPGDGIREDAQHLAQELAVERQGKPQREGHGNHELPNGYIGQQLRT